MALIDDVALALESGGVAGASTTWDLLRTYMPEPSSGAAGVVAVFDTGSHRPPEADAVSSRQYDFPSFQVRIKPSGAMDYATAHAKAMDVFDALHDGVVNNLVWCFARHTPLPIGHDMKDRPELAINFDCMRTRTS